MIKESDTFDVMIVGGGVMGCAIAYRLASLRLRVVLLEKEAGLARHASGRSSGVLHTGFHFPAESLQAQLCLEGASRLHEYCDRRGILHRRRGRLMVAQSEEEIGALETFVQAAHMRGCGT